jgi:hypothetical protein
VNSAALLKVIETLGPDFERAALPSDRDHAGRVLAYLETNKPLGLRFAFGMDGEHLWEPYRVARDKVERYAEGPQLDGLQIDWLDWDEKSKTLAAGFYDPILPARCERFTNRQCPLLEPMGHEPSHPECNYWMYPRFEELAPKIELYPEWQRFDCHQFQSLFQANMVVGELAQSLGAAWKVIAAHVDEKAVSQIKQYADLTASPENFEWIMA